MPQVSFTLDGLNPLWGHMIGDPLQLCARLLGIGFWGATERKCAAPHIRSVAPQNPSMGTIQSSVLMWFPYQLRPARMVAGAKRYEDRVSPSLVLLRLRDGHSAAA
jgi:hypothetical protein